jgi:hypothetical protein
LELIVGFFAEVAKRHCAEAAVLLLYDQLANKIRFFIPFQKATVSKSWMGKQYPVDLKYDLPTKLDPQLSLIGDIHSHATEAAYASFTDKQDETHQAGVHIVVGQVHREPPDIHCEFVVDGYRFPISPSLVLEGYRRRRKKVPPAWFDRVKVRSLSYQNSHNSKGKTYNFCNPDSYSNPSYPSNTVNPTQGDISFSNSGPHPQVENSFSNSHNCRDTEFRHDTDCCQKSTTGSGQSQNDHRIDQPAAEQHDPPLSSNQSESQNSRKEERDDT